MLETGAVLKWAARLDFICAIGILHSMTCAAALRWALQVVSAAHAVVLASGTLAPVEALSQQLFPGAAAAARIRHFSCGHVVSKDRLLALAIGRSPETARVHGYSGWIRDVHLRQGLTSAGSILVCCRLLGPSAIASESRLLASLKLTPARVAGAAGQGPSGAALDLRHSSRAAPATLDELGRLLLNMCRSVPQVRAKAQPPDNRV